MTHRRALAAGVMAAAALISSPHTTFAQTYPARAITLIVPFPAGGPSDALARAVAQVMAIDLGQGIVVENISGASGTIGLAKFTKASPDGYTIGFGTIGTHVANVALYKKLPYDPVSDFQPIGLAGTASTLLVTKASLPVTNLEQFVAYTQTNRATMTFGSAGIGSISHFSCALLLSSLKLNVTHVPYRGVAPAMNDLIGGHTDFMCDQTTTALPQIAGGTIKAIAVLSDQTVAQLPDVPTAASAGYRDVNVRAWNALFAPKQTPAEIMTRLTHALRFALSDANLRKQMAAVGVELPHPEQLDPIDVSRLIADGIKTDVPLIRQSGETLD
ncbi:tripartite tricarboxylate transporter substrate-binding protein [Bradyrhizobium prioriisuperbiae]|uniref:tripartite tricarboxylate transporter substrate-binding protein n=1 Tax=Bradyrhizobium prioriisuperbiae TaxID=2854389 RepID=UPI0028E4E0DC|nr:tripartite tricarboxylate transporter substrate-binding protein [Bradyrhizobium prioritasuperba]